MHRLIASAVLIATLAGCAIAPPATQAPAVAGAGPNCIPLDQVVTRRVGGPAALDFEMIGGTIYRNQLATACPGMERLGDLAVVAVTSGGEGSRLCTGDRVRVFDPVEARATGLQSYPECVLGDFVEVARQ